METLKRLMGMGWESSSNRKLYERIAERNGLSPRRVFMLAHGRCPRSPEEADARRLLMDKGLIVMK